MTTTSSRRSGFVALAGSPNAGKSTLVNYLLGEKLSIITPKPQTTRDVIRAIVTTDEAQIVLLDTPGIHDTGGKGLNEVLNRRALETLGEVDVIVAMIDATHADDPTRPLRRADAMVLEAVQEAKRPSFLAINKVDLLGSKASLLPLMERLATFDTFEAIVPISALTGDGVDSLREMIVRALPEGPLYYDPELLTDRDLRFLCAELVREQIFLLCSKEVPYSASVEVEAFEEPEEPHRAVRIAAKIHVERPSQKAIVIGKGGAMLKRIGSSARRGIEALVGRKVHLELFVRVEPKWTRRPGLMKKLGYH